MSQLDVSDKAVQQAIDQVIGQSECDEHKNPWALLTHVGQTSKIKVSETGESFDEFIEELSEGRLMYGIMKFNIHGVYKIAFISWCPDGVDGVTKGKFSVWNKHMESILKGKYHTQVMARREEDIDREQMIKKFKVATGSSYATTGSKVRDQNTVNTAKQSISIQQQQIQSGVAPRMVSDYQDEALKKQSEQFWSKQQDATPSSAAATSTTTSTAHSELAALKQQSNQFWSSQQQQTEQPTTTTTTTSTAQSELAALKQKSNQFWSSQQQEPSSTTQKTSAPLVKGDVGALRNKFAEQARVSSEDKPSSGFHGSVSSSVKSMKDRIAEQEQQQQQQQEQYQAPPPVTSSSRLPPPPSAYHHHDEEEEEEEEQQYQAPVTTTHLPPVPTTTMVPPNMIPPNMVEEEEAEPEEQQHTYESTSPVLPPVPAFAQQQQQYEQPEEPVQQQQEAALDGIMYRAMYDFETNDSEELSFYEDDVLIVTENNGDWWTGYRQADISKHTGLVPANYLEPM